MRERSIGFAAQERDLLDALLDGREHPQPEQVDLEEARVGAGVLVPLAVLAPLHRRRLDRDELDERPRRDDHAARVLGQVARQPGDLAAELPEGPPARRGEPGVGAGHVLHLLPHLAGVPAVRDAREPLQLRLREPERLADVADGAARAVGGEARHERRVLAAVALGDGDDQLLADVAREVEVDVGDGLELAVQEAAEREPGVHRIDVREPGQVADDRADRAPPPAPRRQQVARRAGAAHLGGHVARELEHLPVEEEEAGEAELGDQRELVSQPLVRAGAELVRSVAVALVEGAAADLRQLGVRRVGPSEKSG